MPKSMYGRICAAWLIALLLVFVTAGCGSAGGGDNSSEGVAAGVEMTTWTEPAVGELDEITWAMHREPYSLDYAKAGSYAPDIIISQMADKLINIDADFSLQPGIAESWEYVDDTTLVFTIRQGVRFWDGQELTVDDVVYSLNRSADVELPSNHAFMFDSVKSIEATGPHEVTVSFSNPDSIFLRRIAWMAGVVVEKEFCEKAGEAFGTAEGGVMYSGPFKFVRWDPGKQVVLERNADYWDAEWIPKAKKLTMKWILDDATRTNALLSGEVDGSYELPPNSFEALQNAENGSLYFGQSLQLASTIPCNADNPLGVAEVRQALRLAIDRQQLVDGVFQGAAIPNYTLTPYFCFTVEPDEALNVYQAAYDEFAAEMAEPDIEKAKELVADVPNLDDPIKLAYQAGNQLQTDMATVIQQAAQSIGLNMELVPRQPLDYSNMFYNEEYREGYDAMVAVGYSGVADPLNYPTLSLRLFNWIGYESPEVGDLLSKAAQALDPVARAEYLVEAQDIYMQEAGFIPLVAPLTAVFVSNRVTGVPATFAYMNMPSLAKAGAPE